MKYTIDRIESNFAVCEDENGKMSEISILKFPWKVKEGTAFTIIGKDFKILDNAEIQDRIKAKMDKLFKNK